MIFKALVLLGNFVKGCGGDCMDKASPEHLLFLLLMTLMIVNDDGDCVAHNDT